MSYILDALRKAEQARPIGTVPTIETLHPAPVPQARTRWWPWAVVAVGLANAATLGWIFSAPPAPVTPVAPVAPATTAAAAPSTAASSTPAPGPALASESIRAQTEPETPPTSVVVPGSDPVSTAAPAPIAPTLQVPPTRPAAVPPPSRAPGVAKAPPVDSPAVPSPRMRVDVPAISEPRATETKRAPAPAVSAAVKDEVPAAFREAFPTAKLDALVYADTPAGRMAFINGRRYGEGDSLDPQTRIDEITQEGVVLRHRGQRFLLR
jgi:Type II secretion system protein B